MPLHVPYSFMVRWLTVFHRVFALSAVDEAAELRKRVALLDSIGKRKVGKRKVGR